VATKYDREKIHRLFLNEKGNVQAVSLHPDTPSSRTIARYAQEGNWHAELSDRSDNRSTPSKSAKLTKPTKSSDDFCGFDDSEDKDDIERLERILSVLYQFLVPGTLEGLDMLELKPKTYAEAVKCYLEVDSRIDGKKGKHTDSGLDRWEDIVRRCLPSPSMDRG
jgi:hypothetical protein